MADYTLVNLRADVEDMAPQFGMGDGIEARFARKPLGLEKSGSATSGSDPTTRFRSGTATASRRRSTSL